MFSMSRETIMVTILIVYQVSEGVRDRTSWSSRTCLQAWTVRLEVLASGARRLVVLIASSKDLRAVTRSCISGGTFCGEV